MAPWGATGSAPGRMFAAIPAAGAFRSDDAGDSWQPVNQGLHSEGIRQHLLTARRAYRFVTLPRARATRPVSSIVTRKVR